jgi:hypothetical protein
MNPEAIRENTTTKLRTEKKHPRFKKEFAASRHQPFGKASDYVKCVENADSLNVAKLLRLAGMLMQTKVYLFWASAALKHPQGALLFNRFIRKVA